MHPSAFLLGVCNSQALAEDGRRRLGCLQAAGYSEWEREGNSGWGVYWGRGVGEGERN